MEIIYALIVFFPIKTRNLAEVGRLSMSALLNLFFLVWIQPFLTPSLSFLFFLFCLAQNGLNALHLASKEGHVEVVAELIKQGANVDAATKVCSINTDKQ